MHVTTQPSALQPGQKVEVNWGRNFGWLPGVFQEYGHGYPEEGDEVVRCKVKMDNGFPCEGFGYAQACVRPIGAMT